MLTAVLLNAALPGAGNAFLGRWIAAVLWCVATLAAYIAGIVALLYAAVAWPWFARFWTLGELRLLAIFLLPGILAHASCCASVLPSVSDRRVAVGCAAAAMILWVVLVPRVEIGLRKWAETVAPPCCPVVR